MTLPAAYLFDMDGLLLDTERLTLAAFLDCAEAFDLETAKMEPFFMSLVGISAARSDEMLLAFLGPDRDAARVVAMWRDRLAARLAEAVPVKPTVRDTLQALTAQGGRMAVVTSTLGDKARHHLDRAGLLSHFQFVLGGDEVSANKPDPAPYREAAERLSLPPSACAAFEDSDYGITAAAAAGCCAVQIPDLRLATQPFPDVGQLFAPTLEKAVAAAQGRFAQASGGQNAENLG